MPLSLLCCHQYCREESRHHSPRTHLVSFRHKRHKAKANTLYFLLDKHVEKYVMQEKLEEIEENNHLICVRRRKSSAVISF